MAHKFRILWDNEWDGGAVDASTAAADFPAINTQHIWRKRVWRSTSVVTQWLRCDLGVTPPAVNSLVIENHNIPSGAIVQLIGSSTPLGADITISLTPVTPGRIVYMATAPMTWRYWRITMNGGGGSYFEIGRVFLGDYFEFQYHYRTKRPGFTDPSERVMSDAGQIASNQLERYRRFLFSWSPGAVSEAEYEDLFEIFEAIGTSVPYWITYDSDATPPTATFYVLNTSDWSFEPLILERYGFSLDVEEAR